MADQPKREWEYDNIGGNHWKVLDGEKYGDVIRAYLPGTQPGSPMSFATVTKQEDGTWEVGIPGSGTTDVIGNADRLGTAAALAVDYIKEHIGLSDAFVREGYIFPDEYIERHSQSYEHSLLARLKQDCDYFLGAGDGHTKHLWAGDVSGQIEKMKEIWDSLDEKPEWLTEKDISIYKEEMEIFNYSKQQGFNREQIHELAFALHLGIDPTPFSDPRLTPQQMDAACNALRGSGGVDVVPYIDKGSTAEQIHEIARGLKAGIDPSFYADSKYSPEEMRIMLMSLEDGSPELALTHRERYDLKHLDAKTMESWHQSGVSYINEYLSIGDKVSDEMVDYFRNQLEPAHDSGGIMQLGEPYSHEPRFAASGEEYLSATYSTFVKDPDHVNAYRYAGECFRGTLEPNEAVYAKAKDKAHGSFKNEKKSPVDPTPAKDIAQAAKTQAARSQSAPTPQAQAKGK